VEKRTAPSSLKHGCPYCTLWISRGVVSTGGEIISKKLSTYVVQAQMLKEGEDPAFHMASYLLDVICAINVFTDMN
jgi:hypothetical protein